jgi:hypothetical protein
MRTKEKMNRRESNMKILAINCSKFRQYIFNIIYFDIEQGRNLLEMWKKCFYLRPLNNTFIIYVTIDTLY